MMLATRSLALITGLLYLQAVASAILQTCASAVDFFSPAAGGGSMLDDAGDGFGEPLNVIISGLSSSDVLTDAGFLNFAQSLGLSTECLGLHLGNPFSANLGDGNGAVNQTVELRADFGNSELGTCLESLTGGNHLRLFRQNGSLADSGALFLAVSQEENVFESHTIAPDGYDKGRDALVATATASQTTFNGVTYSSTTENITGLLPVGTAGVNHAIALDGIAKLLTVTIV
ncbi:hypothetical protein DFH11DRAFT_1501170 [Phellopilus nigrolimitatus]|nr:hypothetical protein DFH11DRAFT_1501170 [Phellopilus nigrolimitatus]